MKLYDIYKCLDDVNKEILIGNIFKDANFSKQNSNYLLEYILAELNSLQKDDIINLYKDLNADDKELLLDIVRTHDREMFDKLHGEIYDFEDIVNVDLNIILSKLMDIDKEDIVKSTYAASPTVTAFFKKCFYEVDFDKLRMEMGQQPIDTIIKCQNTILSKINQ